MRRQLIKRYFLTGLLIWVPLAITAWVLSLIVNTMDQSLLLLPKAIHPQTLFGFNIPGAGVILTLAIILLTGLLAANFIGQRLVSWWEKLLARIPVVNSIYHSVKQVSDTLFSSSGNAFRKALLIEYPRAGSWTIAFLTGKARNPLEKEKAPSAEEELAAEILKHQGAPEAARAAVTVKEMAPRNDDNGARS